MKVTKSEQVLVEKMRNFKKVACTTMSSILHGVEIATTVAQIQNDKLLKLTETIKKLNSIIDSFRLETINDSDDISIYWELDSSKDGRFSYRNNCKGSKPLTTTTLMYALMSFEREVCSRLSIIQSYIGYSYQCCCLETDLKNIIVEYSHSS